MNNPIICDTNVWYNMAEYPKLFNAVIDNRLQLVPTGISLKELITNPKTLDGKNNQVFTCLRRFMSDARIYLPFIQFYNETHSIRPKEEDLVIINTNVENFHKRKEVANREELHKKFTQDFNSFNVLKEKINASVLKKREEFNAQNDSFENFYSASLPMISEVFEDIINQLNKVEGFKINEELYRPFFKTLLYFDWTKITENLKTASFYKTNDFNDVFNLCYLRQGELFWTFENRKKKNFKKAMIDVGLEDYLFDKNEEWNKYLTK